MSFRSNLHQERGQALVEYVLLLMVVSVLAFTVFRSDAFKGLLGPDAQIFKVLKLQQEYSFRHGSPLGETPESSDYNGNHHTYKNPETNASRFFAPTRAYP